MSDSLQLINEDKEFNQHVTEFLDKLGISKNGLSYHIVSVFGSQSTGKSTLLNALFGTRFNVMDEASRQQTTKGIWMARSQLVTDDSGSEPEEGAGESYLHVSKPSSDVIVMDVEGTDGRERGEDQDFERKSALFALATSEVLIVNMWENQVGLYQGANMGLLKTVFEVNLTLFQASNQTPRSMILFVIRDHIGTTPLANLAQTLLNDLSRAWDSIAKPDSLKDSTIEDFFDVRFEALPHKVLLPEKFELGVDEMAKRFGNEYFKPEYHRQVPLDGWNMYAANIWEQIEQNKDLDLPTQQILVARFRCTEIANQAVELFDRSLKELELELGDPEVLVENFGTLLKKVRDESLELYDSMASRYATKVYQGQRLDLIGQVDSKLMSMFAAQVKAIHKAALDRFDKTDFVSSSGGGGNFGEAVDSAKDDALEFFKSRSMEAAAIDQHVFTYDRELKQFVNELETSAQDVKKKQIDKIAAKCSKKINHVIHNELDSYFAQPDGETWNKVMQFFYSTAHLLLHQYANDDGDIDFGVGAPRELNAMGEQRVMKQAWRSLDKKLGEVTMASNVLSILQDRFDAKFRYDKNNVPIVWTAMDDIETPFANARDETLKLLPILAVAQDSSGEMIEPDIDIRNEDEQTEDDDEFASFAIRIPTNKRTEIVEKFKRQADAAFVDAKRSTTQSATQIPWYMFVLLVVLGWNEFMAVLRNPFLFVFVLFAGAGAWITFTMGLWPTIYQVSTAMYDRSMEIAKHKLREVLEVPAQQHHQQSQQQPQRRHSQPEKPKESTENIELKEL